MNIVIYTILFHCAIEIESGRTRDRNGKSLAH